MSSKACLKRKETRKHPRCEAGSLFAGPTWRFVPVAFASPFFFSPLSGEREKKRREKKNNPGSAQWTQRGNYTARRRCPHTPLSPSRSPSIRVCKKQGTKDRYKDRSSSFVCGTTMLTLPIPTPCVYCFSLGLFFDL